MLNIDLHLATMKRGAIANSEIVLLIYDRDINTYVRISIIRIYRANLDKNLYKRRLKRFSSAFYLRGLFEKFSE